MKPGPGDHRHKLLICGAELRELKKHTGDMAEAFGLDRKIENYQGTRPITLYRWDLDCLLDVIDLALEDKRDYPDQSSSEYQALKRLGEQLHQEYDSVYGDEELPEIDSALAQTRPRRKAGQVAVAIQPPISHRIHGQTRELLRLKLSQAQRLVILRYTDLPDHLAGRLTGKGSEEPVTSFTPDELDELLDHLESAVYRAKGNEKQKVLRIIHKVSERLGSSIDLASVASAPPVTATVFQIKMTLKGIDPPIWRRIQTKDCSLARLHWLIQVAMGWEFEHPYRFIIGDVEFMDSDMVRDEDTEDASTTMLGDVIPTQNRRPRFCYEYDFGDEWLHQLIVEERLPPAPAVKYPRCLAGERACPPEDCGGSWGYFRLLDGEHHMLEWLGKFDPEAFDIEAVNKKLAAVR